MKALRLYDRLGLLTPADVDPNTGYRPVCDVAFPISHPTP
jgi:hypothetical protein